MSNSKFSFITPIRYAKGVGEKKSKFFNKMGINTLYDLFWHFPSYYEDRTHIISIAQASPGKRQVIQGKVLLIDKVKSGRGLSIFKVPVRDRSGTIYAIWYNQDYIAKLLKKNQEVVISGKIEIRPREKQILVDDFEILDGKEDSLNLKRIVPFYPLTEGISQRVVRRIMKINLEKNYPHLIEHLPLSLREKYSLIPFKEALTNIHFPKDFSYQRKAYKRLVFDELFLLQTALALKRRDYKRGGGVKFKVENNLVRNFLDFLPFSLTPSQRKVINEIFKDMASSQPMNRLLQGDVGSGKTVVAIASLLAAVGSGYQAALMAPTEILAQQHYLRTNELLSSLDAQPFLLISELQQKEKEKIKNEIRDGTVKLIIGTHALIQKEVQFCKLGMVVIDEQHKFGVMQRATLRDKGVSPDVLVMTATPIPRTLALTCYGDLDVSVIDELPPGRKSVVTRWVSEGKRGWAYQFVSSQIEKGRQAYFVYPLIEESEEIDLRAAQDMLEKLRKDVFPQFKVALLHGRMRREEKELIMRQFCQGEINIMVCTTVIEVGVDVSNATIMVIENAERFGMAQLHQLRGRVGRGEEQSYCFLLAGRKISEEAVKRMKVMCRTSDGFQIAEEDLKLRGPGQFFGTRQWGELDLKIANLLRNQEMLNLARSEAFSLVREDPLLSNYPLLSKAIKRRFPYQWELAKVG